LGSDTDLVDPFERQRLADGRLVTRREALAQAVIERAVELVMSAVDVNELLDRLRLDRQGPALDGDFDVPLRVQAGKLGPDHVPVVPGQFLDPETLGRRERRRARPWRLQPVGQAREQGAEYCGCPGGDSFAMMSSHFA